MPVLLQSIDITMYRVTVPLMITVDVLLSNAVFDEYVPLPQYVKESVLSSIHSLSRQSFPDDLLTLVKEEVVSTTDTKKLLASVNVYVTFVLYAVTR